MLKEKTCLACTKLLVNRRPQTRTCSGCCRTKLHRMLHARPISVKLVLSKTQFDALKHKADDLGLLINQLIIAKAMQSPTPSIYS